eukprot:scaffold277178_cov27-Prasinocladus_malaysianus.AAC.2
MCRIGNIKAFGGAKRAVSKVVLLAVGAGEGVVFEASAAVRPKLLVRHCDARVDDEAVDALAVDGLAIQSDVVGDVLPAGKNSILQKRPHNHIILYLT